MDEVTNDTWARPTANEVTSKRNGSAMLRTVAVPPMAMTQTDGFPGRTGDGGCDTDRERYEPRGSPASKAADQKRLMQALAAGSAMSERIAARSVLTWAALEWKATTSAACHEPPSGSAAVARVEATAVTVPADAVKAALRLLRSPAHAGCAVSHE